MYEPDVALTDYMIGLECVVLSYLLFKKNNNRKLTGSFLMFFLSLALASFAGGTVHGFFNNVSKFHDILWFITMLAMGMMAFSAFRAAIKLKFKDQKAKLLTNIGWIGIFLYLIIISLISQSFFVAVFFYLSTTIFLLVILVSIYKENKNPEIKFGIYGLLMTFVSSFIQQVKIGLHALYFNHNALYHVLQFFALLLLFRAFRWLVNSYKMMCQHFSGQIFKLFFVSVRIPQVINNY